MKSVLSERYHKHVDLVCQILEQTMEIHFGHAASPKGIKETYEKKQFNVLWKSTLCS